MPRLLITAGPTHEPIDRVRYIANRSSGRLGVALADRSAHDGWDVTLLLGPVALRPSDPRVRVVSFVSTADLESLLQIEFARCDVLVMAAAVADYRPVRTSDSKVRRTEAGLVIELESTPDLLAACSSRRTPGQRIVGFALEPRERLVESARAKVSRKGLDLCVANPLETMDAPTIEATLVGPEGVVDQTDGAIDKGAFAGWLLERIVARTRPAALARP